MDLKNTLITQIGKYAFAHCVKLEEVRLPATLEEICEGAFKICGKLKKIEFGSNSQLRKIGSNAFQSCEKLKDVSFPPRLEFIGNYVFQKCKIRTLDFRKTKVKHIGINSIHSYCQNAYFSRTISLTSIINNYNIRIFDCNEDHLIQKDVRGYYFFNGAIFNCYNNINNLLIRRGVERILERCFYGRWSLYSVLVPASVVENISRSFCW